jgi:hypothetical protein
LYWAAFTEVHPAPASVTTGGSSLSQLPPPKNVSLRRSCGACLRRPPCGAGARPLKHPEVPWSHLRCAPPDPAVPCPLPPLWCPRLSTTHHQLRHGRQITHRQRWTEQFSIAIASPGVQHASRQLSGGPGGGWGRRRGGGAGSWRSPGQGRSRSHIDR